MTSSSSGAISGLSEEQIQVIVDSAVDAIVDTAPATLDTLNELAAALGDDANYAASVTASLAGKVDKATATGSNSLAIGEAASASTITFATVIGAAATVTATNGTAIGYSSTAGNSGSALGNTSEAGQNAVAIGTDAQAQGVGALALGYNTTSNNTNGISIGTSSVSGNTGAIAIGYSTSASANYSVALGYDATASGVESIAIGNTSIASGVGSVALGRSVQTAYQYSIGIGYGAVPSGDNSIAIGRSTNTNLSTAAVVLGFGAEVSSSSNDAIAIGRNATVNPSHSGSVALGSTTSTRAANEVTVGTKKFYAGGGIEAPLQINAQVGTTYTFVLLDADKLVTLSNASAITATLPPNSSVAYPTGTKINMTQLGAGQVTVAPGSGVTIRSTPGSKTRAQYSSVTAIKIATDEWLLTGDLAA